MLKSLTNEYKSHVSSQLLANELENKQNKGKDKATIIKEVNENFEFNWRALEYRLRVIPGKEFMHGLNLHLQNNFKVSITYAQIAQFIQIEELNNDIKVFFNSIEKFKTEALGVVASSRVECRV